MSIQDISEYETPDEENKRLLAETEKGVELVDTRKKACACILFAEWRVFRMIMSYIVVILSGGILASYSLFQTILTKHGTFNQGCGNTTVVGLCETQNEKLSNLYYISQGVGNGLALFVGFVYDMGGPRVSGVVGSGGVVLAMLLVFVALTFDGAEGVLYVGVPLANLAGTLSSFSIFGFGFMFGAEHIALVLGIGNSAYQASALLIYVVQELSYVLPLGYVFLIMSGFPVLAILMSLIFLPTQYEYLVSGEQVTGTRPSVPKFLPLHLLRDLWDVLKQYPFSNLLFYTMSTFMYTWYTFYLGEFTPFTNVLYADQPGVALRLQFFSPIFFSVIGVLGTPISGLIYDKTGSWPYLLICFIVAALSGAGGFFAVEGLAFVQLVLIFCVQSLWYSLISKWASLFAPPELYGTYLSLVYMLAGIVQMALNFAIEAVLKTQHQKGFFLYFYTLLPFAGVATLLLFISWIYFLKKPPPKVPPVCRTTGNPLCG